MLGGWRLTGLRKVVAQPRGLLYRHIGSARRSPRRILIGHARATGALARIEPRRAKAGRIRLNLEALRPHAEYTAAIDGAEISVTPVAEEGRAHLRQKAHAPLFWRLVCLVIHVAH
jgi:hypothetical protein